MHTHRVGGTYNTPYIPTYVPYILQNYAGTPIPATIYIRIRITLFLSPLRCGPVYIEYTEPFTGSSVSQTGTARSLVAYERVE